MPIYTVPAEGGDVAEAVQAIAQLPAGRAYLRVRLKVKDVIPMPDRVAIEEAVAPTGLMLCEIQPVREKNRQTAAGARAVEEIRHISPMDVALEYYRMRFESDMDDELKDMLQQCIDQAEKKKEEEA